MSIPEVYITGIGSISVFGPIKGLIPRQKSKIRSITAWPARGSRYAMLAEPFRAADIVPGLKTRRLDRLSVWALVASSLALQDAGVDPQKESLSNCGVVFGTGLGPLELSSAFCRSADEYGYSRADAIVFPETLDNSPPCHVAKAFGLKGPNITFSCRGVSGEAAIERAASILEHGEADLVVVMAGDTLVQALYDCYELSRVLAPDCFGKDARNYVGIDRSRGFIPGEGLAAFVMECGGRYLERGARAYGRYRSGCLGGDLTATPFSWGENCQTTVNLMHKALGSAGPADVRLIVASGNGSAKLDAVESESIREVFKKSHFVEVVFPKKELGEFDGNALLRLAWAFPGRQKGENTAADIQNVSVIESGWFPEDRRNLLMLLGASTGGGRAVITIELPGEYADG
jgi:3-oxoacyl-[acyl-carrier-protein] synthase II